MCKRVLITSGPTREPLDPIRFLGNRSSGLTGLYLAKVFAEKYASEVVFISGPVCRYPSGVKLIKVETAQEMHEAVFACFSSVDAIIMVAAVADFRPARSSPHKIKKAGSPLLLELERNPDILKEAGNRRTPRQVLVGFAAETENALENGKRKLFAKNLDILVINEISEQNPAFGAVPNRVTLMTPDQVIPLPSRSKAELARVIAAQVVHLSILREKQ
ncbi:MAG TPA: hypothetical protein ENN40_10165 [Candidatus Aminicenantes bacterium]|nr:hypothetical protein [Candidatus Aminicenantes bacterium]